MGIVRQEVLERLTVAGHEEVLGAREKVTDYLSVYYIKRPMAAPDLFFCSDL